MDLVNEESHEKDKRELRTPCEERFKGTKCLNIHKDKRH